MLLYLLKLVDEFPDTVGFARIVQALQATEWPELQMKGNKLILFALNQRSLQELHKYAH